jgi:hypothetical protein
MPSHMLKNEIQSNMYSMTSRMITPFHYIIRSIFYSVFCSVPRFSKHPQVCVYIQNFSPVFHFEGYLVRIIIVTSLFRQDLNISESNLSLSSDGNRGTAPLIFFWFCIYEYNTPATIVF